MTETEFGEYLKERLGDSYQSIIKGILDAYRVISNNPVRLRLKEGTAHTSTPLAVDVDGPRFHYLYAAIVSPKDEFDKSRVAAVKYRAHKEFLSYYKCAVTAVNENWLNIVGYYPSELDKMLKKLSHVFKVEHSKPPSNRAVTVKILDPKVDLEKYLLARKYVSDPYEFSDDLIPDLPKPIAEKPPLVRKKIQAEAEGVNWNEVEDDE